MDVTAGVCRIDGLLFTDGVLEMLAGQVPCKQILGKWMIELNREEIAQRREAVLVRAVGVSSLHSGSTVRSGGRYFHILHEENDDAGTQIALREEKGEYPE